MPRLGGTQRGRHAGLVLAKRTIRSSDPAIIEVRLAPSKHDWTWQLAAIATAILVGVISSASAWLLFDRQAEDLEAQTRLAMSTLQRNETEENLSAPQIELQWVTLELGLTGRSGREMVTQAYPEASVQSPDFGDYDFNVRLDLGYRTFWDVLVIKHKAGAAVGDAALTVAVIPSSEASVYNVSDLYEYANPGNPLYPQEPSQIDTSFPVEDLQLSHLTAGETTVVPLMVRSEGGQGNASKLYAPRTLTFVNSASGDRVFVPVREPYTNPLFIASGIQTRG